VSLGRGHATLKPSMAAVGEAGLGGLRQTAVCGPPLAFSTNNVRPDKPWKCAAILAVGVLVFDAVCNGLVAMGCHLQDWDVICRTGQSLVQQIMDAYEVRELVYHTPIRVRPYEPTRGHFHSCYELNIAQHAKDTTAILCHNYYYTAQTTWLCHIILFSKKH